MSFLGELRKEDNLTQMELTEELPITQSHLSRLENQTTILSWYTSNRISEVLEVEPDALFRKQNFQTMKSLHDESESTLSTNRNSIEMKEDDQDIFLLVRQGMSELHSIRTTTNSFIKAFSDFWLSQRTDDFTDDVLAKRDRSIDLIQDYITFLKKENLATSSELGKFELGLSPFKSP
ncbi:MAG: helix-turn-helix domain-containing protein [bacterium]